MYAIVREGQGKYYTSMVFGYYQSNSKSDYEKRFWVVLNKDKTALIKQSFYQRNTKYLIPMVLIVDADESKWNTEKDKEQSISFLPTGELLSMIDHNRVPQHLLQQCIELALTYQFEAYREIKTETDIRDLNWVSGGFHDAFIAEMKDSENSLYLLFDGTWGCKIEVWFDGEVSYDVSSRDPEEHNPYWFDSTVAFKDGFIYLIDHAISTEDIGEYGCWFKARNMKYHVIPD